MKKFFIIVDKNTDKIVKRFCVNGEIEEWQKQIILTDFCAINELSLMQYSIFEIR